MTETRAIDLHLPDSWNSMSTEELELICSVFISRLNCLGNECVLSMNGLKAELFFKLTGLEIMQSGLKDERTGEEYDVVRKTGDGKTKGKKDDSFPIYRWQVVCWMDERMKWLEEPSALTRFPYPRLTVKGKDFEGPSVLMQNVSWRQYRLLGDYMTHFLITQNEWVALFKKKNPKAEVVRKMEDKLQFAKGVFLSTLFNARMTFVDRETGMKVTDFKFSASQIMSNELLFRDFPDYKFQCILIWWTGMMNYLKKKFPKCFRQGNPKKQEQVNPLELYTRTTATMEKYLGLKEEEVNRELFTIVLQHLNDMAVENERLEQLHRKG